MADKFGHGRVDKVTYSVPIRHAYRPVWVKLYHDRMAIAVGAEVVAQHARAFSRGAKVRDTFHVLPLLERKHRAVAEATALVDWRLAPVCQQVRAELALPVPHNFLLNFMKPPRYGGGHGDSESGWAQPAG